MPQQPLGIGNDDRGVQSAPRGAVTPWSFAMPMAAGVFLGVLVFGLLLLAYLQGQARTGAGRPDTVAKTTERQSRDAGTASPAPNIAAQEADSTQALPKLPGLIEANRLHLKTACIAGTIGHRQKNGWSQAVARDAPRRCIATSQ